MKERVPYRNVLICYKGNTCVSWRTIEEFHELFKTGEVNWYEIKGKKGTIYFNEEKVKEQYEKIERGMR